MVGEILQKIKIIMMVGETIKYNKIKTILGELLIIVRIITIKKIITLDGMIILKIIHGLVIIITTIIRKMGIGIIIRIITNGKIITSRTIRRVTQMITIKNMATIKIMDITINLIIGIKITPVGIIKINQNKK